MENIPRKVLWFSLPGLGGLVAAAFSGDSLASGQYVKASIFLALSFVISFFAYREDPEAGIDSSPNE